MKVFAAKLLALGGLVALFVSTGNGAFAQVHHHTPMRHAHHKLQKLHHAYARAISHGNRAAAERAHLRARAIRARLRARHHGIH